MTFHDMEKRIKNVNDLVLFVCSLRDQYKKDNPNDTETLAKYGYIADYLCAYRNVLQYEKEYEEISRIE